MSENHEGLSEQFGPHVLGELIRQGGMGAVYRAMDRALGREVAVKLIRDFGSGASDGLLTRFQQEARAIAQLRSPHTVELYTFNTTPAGMLYDAMELLDGSNLLVARGALWSRVAGEAGDTVRPSTGAPTRGPRCSSTTRRRG